MTRVGGDNTLLLAVGVFDAQPDFEQALEDLHCEGFNAREMCLLGTRAAFADLVKKPARPFLPRSGKPLHQRERFELPWLLSDLDLRGTSGILLRTLAAQATAENERRLSASSCFIDDLGEKLGPLLADDALAVLVNATDAAHQSQGARVLLRHSMHPVQTYAVRSMLAPER